jgi:hypothetical protein
MSTSEKFTRNFCPCPCGKGKILEHIDSPDNPWSKTHFSYELECPDCSKEWVLEETTLFNRLARSEMSKCWSEQRKIEGRLGSLGKRAIEDILAERNLESFKKEHRMLTEARVCREGPIRYARARKSGVVASEMCVPIGNIVWIIENLQPSQMKDEIQALQQEREISERKEELARGQLNKMSLSDLRPTG